MPHRIKRRTFLKGAALASLAAAANSLTAQGAAAAADSRRGDGSVSSSAPEGDKVVIYPLPACYSKSEMFSVSVEGSPVPVIGYHNNGRIEYHYAHFSFSGTVNVSVTAHEEIKSYRIRPENYAIGGTAKGNTLTFEVPQSRYLMVNINALQNLIIFADPPEKDVPASSGDTLFNITNAPYRADNTGAQNVTDVLQRAIDAASAVKGTVYVPAGVYKISSITMKSHVNLYLEGGAVLRGTGKDADYAIVNPKAAQSGMDERVTTFIQYEEGALHTKLWGRGSLDANGYELFDDKEGDRLRINAIRPNKNSNVTIDGVMITHSRWWTVTPHQCRTVRIENVKVLNTEFRLNTDGINIISCQDALVRHCFTYGNDDSMCVKPSAAGNFTGILEGPDEPVYNAVFDDMVVYGRCHAAKMGLQGWTHASDIWFQNIEVLQARNGIAIQHYQGKATMENIHFVNIHVEDLVFKAHKPYPIRMQITSGGKVKNVEVRNVTFKSFGDGDSPDGYNGQDSIIAGKSDACMIENVAFTNLKIAGKLILDRESGHIAINEFVSGVTFC